MKSEYKGEEVPKSMVPLMAIIVTSWVVLSLVTILITGGLS